MKKSILLVVTLLIVTTGFGQTKFFTKNGKVYFSATSSMENIEATNEKATSILDITTGSLDFAILMKAFNFDRALMQEHFNENYVESDKYPKSTFKGNIVDMASLNFQKDGTYPFKVKGMLTLHGVSKDIETTGTLIVKDGQLDSGSSIFKILLADYNILIPSVVKDKISKEVHITINVNYLPYKGTN